MITPPPKPRNKPPTRPPRAREIGSLGTEFGLVLEAMVETTPGAVGAVLCDDQGDAIDFARDATQIGEIDVQLLGAQIGQTVLELESVYRRHRLDEPCLVMESGGQGLVASAVEHHYVLAMLLDHRSNVAAGLTAFARARVALAQLLR